MVVNRSKLNFDVHLSKKTVLCPYDHSSCLKFDCVKGCSICQNKGNQFAESVRCIRLPYWVKDGRHLAVFRGGHLRV